MALFSFDAQSVDPGTTSFDPMPPGNYLGQIIESDIKPTRSGGRQLALTLEIIDGPHARRRVWDNLNIENSNAQAQEIAQRQLSQLCHALGIRHLNDTAQLHGKPVRAKIAIQPAQDQYPAKNVIKAYAPVEDSVQAIGLGAVPPVAASAAPKLAATRKPWEKG